MPSVSWRRLGPHFLASRYRLHTAQEDIMSSRKRHLTYALSTLAVGATLVLTAPVGAENSTTIDQSTQPHLKSWSNVIPNASKRFVVLADFANAAVLDRETGLVWEQAPDMIHRTWADARLSCVSKVVGSRMGWRLPSFPELASLIDGGNVHFPDPALPAGHPFTNVVGTHYWSATTMAEPNPTSDAWAWILDFEEATVVPHPKLFGGIAWCVRGAMNTDSY